MTAMKLIDGTPLNKIIRGLKKGDKKIEKEYTLTTLLQIFLKVCDAISFSHSKGVIHLDIKPDNILIDNNGQVKIVDFGACHVAGIAEIATPLQRDIALGTASYSQV